MLEQTHIMVADTHADDGNAAAFREIVAPLWERSFSGFHSWLGVPLVHNGRLVGQISIGHRDAAHFNDNDVRLVRAFADQAAVAVANARLYESVRARTRELSALLDVSKSVASQLRLGPLLDVLLQQLRRIVDHSGASLLMLNSSGDGLNVMEPERGGEGLIVRTTFTFEHSRVFWNAMEKREIVIIDDVRGEGELAEAFRRAVGARYDASARPVRSWMAVPVALQDRVIGMLALAHDRPRAFDTDAAALVYTVANQTAVAIENARLFASVQDRTTRVDTRPA
jgi:GAF domain-containing protein